MKVTIAQINTTNGDLDGNVRKIIAAIEKAKADGSDLVVFPEVVTHGYTSQDWFQDPDIIEHALDPLEEIIPATEGITAVVGTIHPNDDKDGRRLYNCAAVISNGELLGFAIRLFCRNTTFLTTRVTLNRADPDASAHLFEVNGDLARRCRLRRFLERQDFLEGAALRERPDGRGDRDGRRRYRLDQRFAV